MTACSIHAALHPYCLQLTVAKDIIAKDGFGSLYKGLSAGLLRQATYTTARLGIFIQLTEAAKKANEGKNIPLWQKAAAGLAAGGIGALVGTPADLALVRMQVSLCAHCRVAGTSAVVCSSSSSRSRVFHDTSCC